jgi:hypothetical protein
VVPAACVLLGLGAGVAVMALTAGTGRNKGTKTAEQPGPKVPPGQEPAGSTPGGRKKQGSEGKGGQQGAKQPEAEKNVPETEKSNEQILLEQMIQSAGDMKEDLKKRTTAVQELQKMGARAKAAIPTLAAILKEAGTSVTSSTYRNQWGGSSIYYTDNAVALRQAAAQALKAIGPDKDPRPVVRACKQALENIPDLNAAYTEKGYSYGCSAQLETFAIEVIELLGQLGRPATETQDLLVHLLEGEVKHKDRVFRPSDPQVRARAAWALGEIGRRTGPVMAALARAQKLDASPDVRKAAKLAWDKIDETKDK